MQLQQEDHSSGLMLVGHDRDNDTLCSLVLDSLTYSTAKALCSLSLCICLYVYVSIYI